MVNGVLEEQITDYKVRGLLSTHLWSCTDKACRNVLRPWARLYPTTKMMTTTMIATVTTMSTSEHAYNVVYCRETAVGMTSRSARCIRIPECVHCIFDHLGHIKSHRTYQPAMHIVAAGEMNPASSASSDLRILVDVSSAC